LASVKSVSDSWTKVASVACNWRNSCMRDTLEL
jgi:hypothetical protein